MDYEKEYKMALERCRWQLANGRISEESATDLFRDLYDSEDERIRKTLVAMVQGWANGESFYSEDEDVVHRLLAWLEKQKEPRDYRKLYEEVVNSDWFKENYKGKSLGEEKQKPLTEEEYRKTSDELYKNHPWYMQKPAEKHDLVAQLKEYLTNTPKEQVEAEWEELKKWNNVGPTVEEYFGSIKSTEWSEEDEKMLNDILGILHSTEDAALANFSEQKKWLKSLRPVKQEWSEEDKKLIDDVINSLCCYQNTLSDYQKEIVGEEIRKLKSLKPQPKQEWSKEDRYKLNFLTGMLEGLDPREFDTRYMKELSSWLKSLRPSWKPSELHLSALLAIFNDPNNIGSQTCQLALTDLYEQLKKLKEDKQ